MACSSIVPRTRRYVEGYGFLPFARNLYNKYGKSLLDTAAKAGPGAAKTASKNADYKTLEPTEELIENKTTEKIMKPKLASDEKEILKKYLFHQRK